ACGLGRGAPPTTAAPPPSARSAAALPVYPVPTYVSDDEDGDAIARTLGDAPGLTINGHGIVTVGKSIDEACFTAVHMERTAKIIQAARLLGFDRVDGAFQEEMAGNARKMSERQASINRPNVDHSDDWRYYTRKLERGQPWNRGWT
ncbi:MAG: class II aldolase/adducin family protein, partial [Chloroflexi bacterium]|nr:class II aldolase/adducin family protein [Chloroflexota bacterium]